MQLAFLMPSDGERERIRGLQDRVFAMRQDQIGHLSHLLRSWRIYGRDSPVELVWRAIKRTIRDKP